jgi:hypothetical protein
MQDQQFMLMRKEKAMKYHETNREMCLSACAKVCDQLYTPQALAAMKDLCSELLAGKESLTDEVNEMLYLWNNAFISLSNFILAKDNSGENAAKQKLEITLQEFYKTLLNNAKNYNEFTCEALIARINKLTNWASATEFLLLVEQLTDKLQVISSENLSLDVDVDNRERILGILKISLSKEIYNLLERIVCLLPNDDENIQTLASSLRGLYQEVEAQSKNLQDDSGIINYNNQNLRCQIISCGAQYLVWILSDAVQLINGALIQEGFGKQRFIIAIDALSKNSLEYCKDIQTGYSKQLNEEITKLDTAFAKTFSGEHNVAKGYDFVVSDAQTISIQHNRPLSERKAITDSLLVAIRAKITDCQQQIKPVADIERIPMQAAKSTGILNFLSIIGKAIFQRIAKIFTFLIKKAMNPRGVTLPTVAPSSQPQSPFINQPIGEAGSNGGSPTQQGIIQKNNHQSY